jgi:hypothetical protein
MKDNFRPYNTYKAFGGVLAALMLGFVVIVVTRIPNHAARTPVPLPLISALFPSILGLLGLYIFIASDKKIKAMKQACNTEPNPAKITTDTKGMLIAFGIGLLIIIFVAIRTMKGLP